MNDSKKKKFTIAHDTTSSELLKLLMTDGLFGRSKFTKKEEDEIYFHLCELLKQGR